MRIIHFSYCVLKTISDEPKLYNRQLENTAENKEDLNSIWNSKSFPTWLYPFNIRKMSSEIISDPIATIFTDIVNSSFSTGVFLTLKIMQY